ncbi:RNA methyltransferase [Bifidobacterium pullorum subsp. saeculare]|uniref:TrmH family RNA methyltransferase n=1 Tax=Bifidobacterium pullorum TaxID=78448 RepID=UPI00195EBAD8|nr:RNA methyltransferase [Bifidobacterium pullorum]MBM6730041.1 RNA methyltransferase [Bifidobacterium pullorum subsp. saeculare]
MPIHQNIIDNPKSERVRRVADLSNRRSRERSGRFLAEGPQSVREAVRCMPQTVTDVYVAVSDDPERSRLDPGLARHGYEGTPETMPDDVPVSALLSPIVAEAAKAGLYVHLCSAGVIERMSRDAQGIVAVGDMQATRDAMTGTAPETPGAGGSDGRPSLVAAFWQVRDPGNAGTVIRAADAAGCAAVVFVDECVDMFNPKVIRATAGSLFHLPVLTMTTGEFFTWCSERGLVVTAADVYGTPGNRPVPLPELLGGDGARDADRAVLFGNEARGLPDDVLERSDMVVSIPIYGRAESLNLGTSAAVMLMSMAMSSRFGRM